ncbi:MAG: hypothetical protein QOK35_1624 [Pseudonocardiales bacterium]|nr:hypothetical protein [Pseudonocardiales bacterium]
MAAIVVGLGVVLAGLWLALGQDGPEIAVFGWLLVVVGLAALAGNLYLRTRGYRMPGRRRP